MRNHGVIDTDTHFTIDPVSRSIKNNSNKMGVIQFDHNSERLTFSLSRFIEGHDMSECSKAEIHYINIEQNTGKTNADVYEVDDLRIDKNDDSCILFSWLISQNATQYAGFVYFAVKFFCENKDGVIDYEWNSGTYQKFGVFKGIQNSQIFVEKYIDVLEKWKQDLIDASTSSTKEQVEKIINEYLEENPIEASIKTVNGIKPDENGNVEIQTGACLPDEKIAELMSALND